jgi:DNA mismatch repair protein MutS
LSSVRNFNVSVKEVGEKILFLHRLQPGGADRSYGIEVGRLAGLPQPVIARARSLLKLLEGEQIADALAGKRTGIGVSTGARVAVLPQDQLGLFGAAAPAKPHPVVERLKEIDPNSMTPMEALALLAKLSGEARE